MSVYVLAQLSIHDRETYDRYASQFIDVLSNYTGRLLAADETPIELEGTWKQQKVCFSSFPIAMSSSVGGPRPAMSRSRRIDWRQLPVACCSSTASPDERAHPARRSLPRTSARVHPGRVGGRRSGSCGSPDRPHAIARSPVGGADVAALASAPSGTFGRALGAAGGGPGDVTMLRLRRRLRSRHSRTDRRPSRQLPLPREFTGLPMARRSGTHAPGVPLSRSRRSRRSVRNIQTGCGDSTAGRCVCETPTDVFASEPTRSCRGRIRRRQDPPLRVSNPPRLCHAASQALHLLGAGVERVDRVTGCVTHSRGRAGR
jgi:Domain of unknown function (DUF1330)